MSELSGKNILITGASSGIGQETANILSRKGASVIITGRNEERLNGTFQNLDRSIGQEHIQIVADLNSDDAIEQLVSKCATIDGLVCCSGINDKAPIKHVTREKIDKMYGANVYGPMLLVKEIVKQKKINKAASIVFISSISSIYATVSNCRFSFFRRKNTC